MRWKLLLAASVLAAAVGAGLSLCLAYWLLGSTRRITARPDGAVLATLLFPVAAVAFASLFVYRHTARRRSLQAMATALLTASLTLAAILAGSLWLMPQQQTEPPPLLTPVKDAG